MKHTQLLALLSAMILVVLSPRAAPEDAATVRPEISMRALQRQVDQALAAYLGTNDTSGVLWSTYYHLNDTNLPKIFDLAIKHPESDASFKAFSWILTNRRIGVRSLNQYGVRSLEYLRDYHTTNAEIGEICRKLGNFWDPMDSTASEFLRSASEKNPDRTARGYATLALGQLLKQKGEELGSFPLMPASTNNQWWVKENAAYQRESKTTDANALFAEARKAFETVETQYGDCPMLPRQGIRKPKVTLAKEATVELFEVNHLVIGREAPEISGLDIEGKPLKLDQYRGRVVLLSFWASWCGPCMQMVPLECALANKFKDQSFSIVGVNGDGTQRAAQKAMQEENMTWPSFWNEGGPNGAIADQWNIHGWPTYFLLDPHGVIRLKDVGYGGISTSNLLNSNIERLLKEFRDQKT